MDLPVITPTSTLLNHRRIHVEVSSKCTLKCPRCPRTELHPDSLNKEISLEEFITAFPKDVLKDVHEITFCGDIGDPIYAKDFLEIVRYVRQTNFSTSIVIVTNGSYKDVDWWTSLGDILTKHDTVTFSVDGWDQQSNEKYRVNSNFESIRKGAIALRQASDCRMNWSAIYFKFNEKEMSWIEQTARELKFDTFETVLSSKFDHQYLVDGVDKLKPLWGWVANTSRYEVRQTALRSQVPIVFYEKQKKHAWAKCMNWEKEMFINVEGLVFPCPWFNSGYLANDFVEKHKDKINIKTRTLLEILADPLWEELHTRFAIAPLEICKLKCQDCSG